MAGDARHAERLVHEYFGVTQETLWKTAREDLSALVERLRRLLAEPEP